MNLRRVLMFVFLSLLLAQAVDRPITPADAVSQAYADLSKLPIEARYDTRYISLYAVPAEQRVKLIQVLSGKANSLSREAAITPVYLVPNTNGSLVRVNIRDYRWDTDVWEQLVDPHFSIGIEEKKEVPWTGGIWPEDGKNYPPNAFKVITKKKTQVLAPWLTETEEAKTKLAQVSSWTGSKMPIVRAEWWFNQVAASVDRKPNYYDFLGIKDEKTFQKAVGADLKLAEEFGNELRESVAISGVTLQPRAIARHGTIGGGYWRTFDFKEAKDGKNPLKVLGKDIEKNYDATEQFAHLPNGLWAVGLFNKAGVLQTTAPDFIASDNGSKSNDKRIHNAASCFRCHVNGGLQDIEGWTRNLLSPPLNLNTPDYQKAIEIRRLYYRKLEPWIAKDRQTYEEAIKEATGGLDSKKYALAYGQLWESYEDAKIDLAQAAASLGCSPQRFKESIEGRIKAGRGDTIISVLVLPKGRINRIPIRQWEELIPEAHLTLRGYQQ